MKAETNPPLTATLEGVSLVRGGPFYRAQQAMWLIRPDHWNFGRRIIFVLTIGWLPLFLITALLNHGGLGSLVREYRVHARMYDASYFFVPNALNRYRCTPRRQTPSAE
jgi:hypothetical protein